MRFALVIVSFAFSILLAVPPAYAQSRVALVIGNRAYRNAMALPNTQNDATDIAAAFQRLGFSVRTVHNGTFDDMRRALLQFGRDTRGADTAVIFFAGHGMEIGGENWLVPVDAELHSDRDAENEAISLKSAMLQVANAMTLGLVILDSCRDNPFAQQMQRVSRTRAVDRGLARVEPTDNVLVAYAAKDGTVAMDGRGRNSPFTAAFLNNLEKPGLEIRFLLASVRDEVLAATNRQQQPFVYGSLSRQSIYLKPPVEADSSPVPKADSTTQQSDQAERAWAAAQNSTSTAVLEAFIRRYENSFYAELARAKLEELKKTQVTSLPIQQIINPIIAPDTALNSPSALVIAIKKELSRVGCYSGEIDDKWGTKETKSSIQKFRKYAKVSASGGDEPEQNFLNVVRMKADRVCPLECGTNQVENKGKCIAKSETKRARTKLASQPEQDAHLPSTNGHPASANLCAQHLNMCSTIHGGNPPATCRAAYSTCVATGIWRTPLSQFRH